MCPVPLAPRSPVYGAPLGGPRCVHRPLSLRSPVGHFTLRKEPVALAVTRLLCIPEDVPTVGASVEGIGHRGALGSSFFHQAPRIRGRQRAGSSGLRSFYEGMTSTVWTDLVLSVTSPRRLP